MPSLGFCLLVAIGARRLVANCPKVSLIAASKGLSVSNLCMQVLVPLLNSCMACVVIVTAVKTISRNEVSYHCTVCVCFDTHFGSNLRTGVPTWHCSLQV